MNKPSRTLTQEIATRARSIDFVTLGQWLPNPDPVLKALGKDIKIYRELRSDAHIGGCIRRRKAAVKSLDWGLSRGQSPTPLAERLTAIFAKLKMDRILTEILDAPLYGYQPLEVIWGEVGGWIVPIDIIGKPPEWFVFNDENELRLITTDNPMGEELPARKFLLPRQDASYENPYGLPDLSLCFWPATFKKGGLKFWVQFTEKYGSPWVIGKHPRGTPDSETELLLNSLEAMVQDAVAVVPDDASVEIVEAGGKDKSADIYERLLSYCKGEIAIALLGQNQTTEAEANKASATAGLSVTDDIRDSDAALVSEAMNTLVGWICDLNTNELERPEFEMWSPEDDTAKAARDEALSRAGARFKKSYWVRAYGFEADDLEELAPVAAPGGMGNPFSFAESQDDQPPPDQEALDNALDALAQSEAGSEGDPLQALLAPILAAVKNGESPDRLLGRLASLYPQMDASDLQERLARMLFVSKLWGKINAAHPENT